MRTDGLVAVVELQDCQPADPELDSNSKGGKFKPGNIAFRYIRKEVLTFRNDIWRANIIYGAYELGRMAVTAMRHPASSQRQTGTESPIPQTTATVSSTSKVDRP